MFENGKMCPPCQAGRMKIWEELTGDEKFVAEKLFKNVIDSAEKRRSHLFCPLCWTETVATEEKA